MKRARQRGAVPLLLAATALSGAMALSGGTASAANHVVEVRDNYFEPATLTVPAGTAVVWQQVEYQPHTVTAVDGSWDSHPDCGSAGYEPCMYYGDRYERTFAQPGTYEYICRIHGTSMSGTVVVTAAVSSSPPSPSPTAPSPLPTTTSPSPTVTSSPTATTPAATTPPPSPTPSSTSSEPAPSTAPPSSEPTSPEPTTEPTVTASATVSESEVPVGAPADDPGGGGRAVVVVLVALVAVGLGVFGWSQLRAGVPDTEE